MDYPFTIKQLPVGALETNCYIIADLKAEVALIIDPGDDAPYIQNIISDLRIKPLKIIATHGHFDHILAAFELQKAYNIPFFISHTDEFLVRRMHETAFHFLRYEIVEQPPHISGFLVDKQQLEVGDFKLTVISTPGHTPGSICLYNQTENYVLSGDTLFQNGVGRTDFSYASAELLNRSLTTLAQLPPQTRVYAGHGSETTIGDEIATGVLDINSTQ